MAGGFYGILTNFMPASYVSKLFTAKGNKVCKRYPTQAPGRCPVSLARNLSQ